MKKIFTIMVQKENNAAKKIIEIHKLGFFNIKIRQLLLNAFTDSEIKISKMEKKITYG